jgi:hypothetical protein
VLGLAALLGVLVAGPAEAVPVTLEFSGSVNNVADAADFFAATPGDTFSLFLTYDPDLLPGTPSGGATIYETAAGETSITFSFSTSAGDFLTSDNSFPIRIRVENTPPLNPMMPMPGTGDDRFSIEGNFDAITELSVVLVESNLGTNPLSSNALPTTAFGSGPGTWFVAEIDVDRMFSNISGTVSNIEDVTTVPEPSTLALTAFGGALVMARRTRGGRVRGATHARAHYA